VIGSSVSLWWEMMLWLSVSVSCIRYSKKCKFRPKMRQNALGGRALCPTNLLQSIQLRQSPCCHCHRNNSAFFSRVTGSGAAEGSEKRGGNGGQALKASGVRSGEGCPLASRLEGLGERRDLPQRCPGRSPGRKRIFDIFLAHRTRLAVRKKSEKS